LINYNKCVIVHSDFSYKPQPPQNMKTLSSVFRHPVPDKYHQLLHIGETDRRGNLIDFKIPPVIIDSSISISDYKTTVLREHVDMEALPLVYLDAKCFLILRPTALPHRLFIREQLIESGLLIQAEFELDNFIQLADVLYLLDPQKSFHWQWRIIMKSLHDTKIQDQNTAVAFVIEHEDYEIESCSHAVMSLKKKIRVDMGEIPVIVRCNGKEEIALGIHHLHSPEHDAVSTEYNALMHAKNKTSIFSKRSSSF